MDVARHRLRGIRGGRRRAPRRPRTRWITLNEPSVHTLSGMRSASMLPPAARLRGAAGRAPPAPRARPRGGAPRGGLPADGCRHQALAGRARIPGRRGRGRGRHYHNAETGCSPTRSCPAATRTTAPSRLPSYRGRPRDHLRAARLLRGSTTTTRVLGAPGADAGLRPARRRRSRRGCPSRRRIGGTSEPTSAGRSSPTDSPRSCANLRALPAAAAPVRHRERLLVPRWDAATAVDDPRRIAYLEAHLALADAIARGVDVRGYYAGRRPTTSSGRPATPSVSGSSTPTTRPRSVRARTPGTGTATSSRTPERTERSHEPQHPHPHPRPRRLRSHRLRGRLLAAYLAEHAPAGTRIALAGRSRARLEEVRAALPQRPRTGRSSSPTPPTPRRWPRSPRRRRASATTVGPYARYGLPLVEACAAAGTHYADLTGEVLFVRERIDRVDAVAPRDRRPHRARLRLRLDPLRPRRHAARTRARRPTAPASCTTTDAATPVKGGISGGTIDSLRAQVEAWQSDPALRRSSVDPYSLSPDRAAEPRPGARATRGPPRRRRDRPVDRRRSSWRRSTPASCGAATRCSDWAYGRGFRYREVRAFGSGLARSPSRDRVSRRRWGWSSRADGLPAHPASARPGAARTRRRAERAGRRTGSSDRGPDATTGRGRRYLPPSRAQGDPGYAATAVMLGETALAWRWTATGCPTARACSRRRPRWATPWWTGCARRASR